MPHNAKRCAPLARRALCNLPSSYLYQVTSLLRLSDKSPRGFEHRGKRVYVASLMLTTELSSRSYILARLVFRIRWYATMTSHLHRTQCFTNPVASSRPTEPWYYSFLDTNLSIVASTTTTF